MEREKCARLLLEAGITNGQLTRHTTWCLRTGHEVTVWTIERTGPDTYSDTILGAGDTMQSAVQDWKRNHTPKGRRGT